MLSSSLGVIVPTGMPIFDSIGITIREHKRLRGMDTFGQRLRFLRKSNGLTQVQLAKKIGIKQPSLSDLESGESKAPDADTLLALCAALHSNPWYLLLGTGNPTFEGARNPEESEVLALYRDLLPEPRAEWVGYGRGLRHAAGKRSVSDPFAKTGRHKTIKGSVS